MRARYASVRIALSVAPDADEQPDFHRLSRRMLHGDYNVAVEIIIFGVLAIEWDP